MGLGELSEREVTLVVVVRPARFIEIVIEVHRFSKLRSRLVSKVL